MLGCIHTHLSDNACNHTNIQAQHMSAQHKLQYTQALHFCPLEKDFHQSISWLWLWHHGHNLLSSKRMKTLVELNIAERCA
jgi:hypothetical protein